MFSSSLIRAVCGPYFAFRPSNGIFLCICGPQGGYSGEMQFDANPLIGLAGLLISPSRGLLVFSPVFIFSAIGMYVWWRAGRTFRPDVYWICLVFSAAHVAARSVCGSGGTTRSFGAPQRARCFCPTGWPGASSRTAAGSMNNS